MKVITGRVVGGRQESTQDFRLTAAEEEELVVALEEIRSGNYEDGHELLRELKGLCRTK